jgi:hypothetical protein
MAQPAQVTTTLPWGEYVVIDNGPATTTTTLNSGAPIGFDTTTGATAQAATPILSGAGNGTVPDFVDDQTVILNSALTGIRVTFQNPS